MQSSKRQMVLFWKKRTKKLLLLRATLVFQTKPQRHKRFLRRFFQKSDRLF